MLDIPAQLKNDYIRLLIQRSIPSHSHNQYLRWLRFYLDFCTTYHHDPARNNSLTFFISKLKEKNQTPRQQEQASHAIKIYYILENSDIIHNQVNQTIPLNDAAQQSSPALTPEKMGWEQIFTDLDAAIRIRHYSPKTYKPTFPISNSLMILFDSIMLMNEKYPFINFKQVFFQLKWHFSC